MNYPLLNRHPELVSGPITPPIRSKRRQAQPHRQIRPMRIALVDQVDLPRPMPTLQLLLAHDRWLHVAEQLKVDKAMDGIARGESGERIVAMLPHSRDKIGRYTDVKRAVMPARQNINARKPFLPHSAGCAAKWTLKQVQGDEEGMGWEIIPHSHPTPNPPKPRHAELVPASIVPQGGT